MNVITTRLLIILCINIALTITTALCAGSVYPVSYTHLRAHETRGNLVCRLLLEKKKRNPRTDQPSHPVLRWQYESTMGAEGKTTKHVNHT